LKELDFIQEIKEKIPEAPKAKKKGSKEDPQKEYQ